MIEREAGIPNTNKVGIQRGDGDRLSECRSEETLFGTLIARTNCSVKAPCGQIDHPPFLAPIRAPASSVRVTSARRFRTCQINNAVERQVVLFDVLFSPPGTPSPRQNHGRNADGLAERGNLALPG